MLLLRFGVELRYPLSLDPFPIFALTFAEAGNVWANLKKQTPLI